MFLPPNMTEFICSNASCAASGISYSTNAKPYGDEQVLRTGKRDTSFCYTGTMGHKEGALKPTNVKSIL